MMGEEQAASIKLSADECRKLLENDAFCFYLQPKVNMKTGAVTGAEALARCVLPDGKVLAPALFVPQMEQSGLICHLDLAILRLVCAHLSDRINRGLPVVCTGVNLSRRHLLNDCAALTIHAITDEYHIPPELIEFELTESLFLNDYAPAKQLVDVLRNFGHRVSIDDFGSGYAGLNLWRELEFDVVKLDRCFLSDDEHQIHNSTLLPDVINMAHRMNNRVIAEGVETEGDCLRLLRYGCEQAQGYYFSRPIPEDVFYQQFSKMGGVYPTPYIVQKEPVPKPHLYFQKTLSFRRRMISFVLAVLFLAICVSLPLVLQQQTISAKAAYEQDILDSLSKNVENNISSIRSEISSVSEIMHSYAVLIGKQKFDSNIEDYLAAMTDGNTNVTFSYVKKDEIVGMLTRGEINQESYENLLTRQTVIGNVFQRDDKVGYDYFAVYTPVFIDRNLTGCLRGLVNASLLVHTNQLTTSCGKVVDVCLVNCYGKVVKSNSGKGMYDTVYNTLAFYAEPTTESNQKILNAVSQREKCSLRLGDKAEYYVMLSPLTGTPYSYVYVVDSKQAIGFVGELTWKSARSAILITGLIIFYFVVILIVVNHNDRRAREAAYRWNILEQFSDTALFVYDCKKDYLELTHNAGTLFRADKYEIKNYFSEVSSHTAVYSADLPVLSQAIHVNDGRQYHEIRVRMKHPTEERYCWCMFQLRYIYDRNVLTSIVGKIVDIDRIQLAEYELNFKAQRDGLTNLYNKVTFEGKVSRRMIRFPAGGLLLVLDVDNFKTINDTYGHLVGDHALKHIAGCLLQQFPDGKIGRVGGDEFAVYVHDKIEKDVIRQRVAELQSSVHEYYNDALKEKLSVSIGYAQFPENGHTYEQLFKSADDAMYRAKSSGASYGFV